MGHCVLRPPYLAAVINCLPQTHNAAPVVQAGAA
jgi:hypothetical protein